jgi:hypothetical protein
MRLAFLLSAAALVSAPALADNIPEQYQQEEWSRLSQEDCIMGDVYACHDAGHIRYVNWQAAQPVQASQPEIHDGIGGPPEFHEGVVDPHAIVGPPEFHQGVVELHSSVPADQECNRATSNGLVRHIGLEQQGGNSVDGAEPWPPPPLQVSSCD